MDRPTIKCEADLSGHIYCFWFFYKKEQYLPLIYIKFLPTEIPIIILAAPEPKQVYLISASNLINN